MVRIKVTTTTTAITHDKDDTRKSRWTYKEVLIFFLFLLLYFLFLFLFALSHHYFNSLKPILQVNSVFVLIVTVAVIVRYCLSFRTSSSKNSPFRLLLFLLLFCTDLVDSTQAMVPNLHSGNSSNSKQKEYVECT